MEDPLGENHGKIQLRLGHSIFTFRHRERDQKTGNFMEITNLLNLGHGDVS